MAEIIEHRNLRGKGEAHASANRFLDTAGEKSATSLPTG
jgi:hypothetical protein